MGYESPDAILTVHFKNDEQPGYNGRRFENFLLATQGGKLLDGSYRHRDLGLRDGVWSEEVLPDVVGNLRFQRFHVVNGTVSIE
jgi:hypothetical protein